MAETLHFRVSSGLKNIIGRELINNKYIAIFELVKNSYDAGASYAKIRFENLDASDASITIDDNGRGMCKEDIIKKWLFVAYSEKRNPSYRDNIKRAVAGAKGVGRFSCDRLGENVTLSSKISSETILHKVSISWNDFEKDSLDDFSDIDVQYDSRLKEDKTSGTSIAISNLREEWKRSDLLALKKALTQLVNPSATNHYDLFEIILEVPAEIQEDSKCKDEREKVNGPITNNIFDVINQKTTKITVKISSDGKVLTTTLNDRGEFLFETTEKSEYSLSNIVCTLYFLNQTAKSNFTRKMGVESVKYGSVFVYKNGFRVYPYGEPGRDFFDIDQRKQQGYKRFLGTRELIGQLEINGEKNNLFETSSRNNGFIETAHLEELKHFFWEYVLKPLEKYVIQIVNWGTARGLLDESLDTEMLTDIERVIKKIKTRTKNDAYLSVKYNQELIDQILQQRLQKISPIEQLREMAEATQNDTFIKTADQVVRHAKELQKRADLANQEAEKTQEQLEQAHAELATTKKQVGLLNARANLTAQDAVDAMHIMKGYADAIDSTILEVYDLALDEKIDITVLRPFFDSISQICRKIMNSYNLVMRTDYSASSDLAHEDLIQFISQYCKEFENSLHIEVENPSQITVNVKFNPLEFSIILDNLIDNSRKANADTLTFCFEEKEDKIILYCRDDGHGLKREANAERLFEPGYTTTSGSGIGLSTIKKYIEKSGGRVTYNREYTKGFEVIIYLA